MAGTRHVQIVGDPETYEVLCETGTTKVLVNRRARLRQRVEALEAELARIRRALTTERTCDRCQRPGEMTGPS